jgi:hypothetical protein
MSNIANNFGGLSATYRDIGKYDSALTYAARELLIAQKQGFKTEIKDAYENLASIYALKHDFDARTRHNHGTKFRIRQNSWHHLYSEIERIL